jgi:lipopolysaccharide biosynthesis glycosyltransferase
VILGEKEFLDSRVGHPAALRLRLFDYVAADRVIYFDADWLCVSDWVPPSPENGSEIVGCRDFILQSEWPHQRYMFDSDEFLACPPELGLDAAALRHDYIETIRNFARLTIPCSRWLNTGFLILNRFEHEALFDKALSLYQGSVGHHPEYFEQPALMKAIDEMSVPIHLLPRRFNVLAAYERKWPASVVGLHIKPKRHPKFLAEISSSSVLSTFDIQRYFIE